MNKEYLTELKNSLLIVTKGPWVSFIEGRDHLSGSSFIRTANEDYDIEFINLRPADQDFIVSARNVMPVLIDEILRLQDLLHKNQISF